MKKAGNVASTSHITLFYDIVCTTLNKYAFKTKHKILFLKVFKRFLLKVKLDEQTKD